MNANRDWYSRHLGQPQPAPQQRHYDPRMPGRPPQQQPQPIPQYQPQSQQWAPQPQPQQPQMVQVFEGHQHSVDEMNSWRGGMAARTNPDACPNCGGNQYFAHIRTKGRGPEPAGHCYDCGYNELFDQGDAAMWGSSGVVQNDGLVQPAAIQVTASPFA